MAATPGRRWPPQADAAGRRRLLAAALATPWAWPASGATVTAPVAATVAASVAATATTTATPASAADLPGSVPVEVEAGVYMLAGLGGQPSPANLGRTGNAGFIVGSRGVMVVETGSSHLHGQALLAAVAQVTPLPVRLVLITHVRQEVLFGASAFQARGVPVHMQRHAAALMAARCATCLKTLRANLGDEAMRGSLVAQPDVLFDDSHVVESIGRPVLVQHHGHASGPGDCSVFDVRSGSLFAGGLLDNRRIPDIQGSDFDGWRQALAALRGLRIDTIVPGHGSAGSTELVATQLRYLQQLESRCAALLDEGVDLSAVPDAAALPEFSRWDLYDTVHRRNAVILFLRLEHQMLLAGPGRGVQR